MPFAVLITFIGGYENGGARLFHLAQSFEEMKRAHAVDGKCFTRPDVGFANEGLRGEVKNEIRFGKFDRALEDGRVLNIAGQMAQTLGRSQLSEQRGLFR